MHLLLESGGRASGRRGGWTFASAAVHAAIIAAAVVTTMTSRTATIADTADGQRLIFVGVRPAPQPPRLAASITHVLGAIREIDFPTLPRFGALDAIDAPRLVGVEFDGGEVTGDASSGMPGDGVFTMRTVERQVVARRDNGRPEYPAILRHAAVEGDVRVRFVVDSAGRVEPASVLLLEESHPLFGAAVVRWLARTRYLPAEIRGRRVRQLVEQRIGFALRP